MQRESAISNQTLEAGGTANIIVTFEDGLRRELTITTQEAEELATKGTDVSPMYVHLRNKLVKPLSWTLSILIATLLLPEIARQWTDRPKEIEFKNKLITDLSDSIVSTVNNAQLILVRTLPESNVADQACGAAKREGTEEMLKQCRAKQLEQVRAETKAYNSADDSWGRKGAILDSQLKAYFPDNKSFVIEGRKLVEAVGHYLRMASSECDKDDASFVINYLGLNADRGTGPLTRQLTPQECLDPKQDYLSAYAFLGEKLLEKREYLVQPILRTNADGFSTDARDFVANTWPFLIVITILALLLLASLYADVKPYVIKNRSSP